MQTKKQNKIAETFKRLSAYDHFLVFLIILTVLKIIDVFVDGGKEAGLHFISLGVPLFIISTVLFFAFKYLFDKRKKYQHALISTFLILLMLSHADPDPVRGLLVIVFLYISKFLIKYKNQNIFNPVVLAIGLTTLLAFMIPAIGIPPLDWSGIDIRYLIFGNEIPLPLLPIVLALIFNVARVKKHPLALSFIAVSLFLGFFLDIYDINNASFVFSTMFIGAAIIVEPKTSPYKNNEQYVYGSAIALLIVGLHLVNTPNASILGLLIGNLVFFFYKRF